MRIVIAVVSILLLTLFVLALDPQVPNSVQIVETNNVFELQKMPVHQKSDSKVRKTINTNEKQNLASKPNNRDTYMKEIQKRAEEQYGEDINNQNIFVTQMPAVENNEPRTTSRQLIKQDIRVVQSQPIQNAGTNRKTRQLTEQEERLAWNQWHANIATEAIRRLNEAGADKDVAFGTIIIFSFMVNNKKEISSISIDSVIPYSEYETIQKRFIPILKTFHHNNILTFPAGTKRTQNKFTGRIINSDFGRKTALPSDFDDDTEIIKTLLYQ